MEREINPERGPGVGGFREEFEGRRAGTGTKPGNRGAEEQRGREKRHSTQKIESKSGRQSKKEKIYVQSYPRIDKN
jgi:hypothetical protein